MLIFKPTIRCRFARACTSSVFEWAFIDPSPFGYLPLLRGGAWGEYLLLPSINT